jgi:hypothetical protein
MSEIPKFVAIAAFIAMALSMSMPVHARGTGTHVNDAKYYGPVYGWRYSPPPAASPEPACRRAIVPVVRNGHRVTWRVRQC